MPKITPFLWFDGNAEEAVEFYLSVFPNSRKTGELRSAGVGPWPEGAVATIAFELDGQEFTALNGGPGKPFNEAVSFVVPCRDQAELDGYWAKLVEGGSPIACGWLMDKFGVRWQIVPENVVELIRTPAGMQAMMGMVKFDIAALEAAGKQG
jgi:predicted 3-demethylubiquinone-9 3-methyltransferase (glyoxalase superfamily)